MTSKQGSLFVAFITAAPSELGIKERGREEKGMGDLRKETAKERGKKIRERGEIEGGRKRKL